METLIQWVVVLALIAFAFKVIVFLFPVLVVIGAGLVALYVLAFAFHHLGSAHEEPDEDY